MRLFRIRPGKLSGSLRVPPSKSHSIRALFFAAMAEGTSHLSGLLSSPDVDAAVSACRLFGAHVDLSGQGAVVRGFAGYPTTPDNVIDAGNSGLVLRFAGALGALCPGYVIVTGDLSIRERRPVQPLLEGLRGLGAFAVSSRMDGRAPIILRGPISPGRTTLEGMDSQPVSALLMVAAMLKGKTEVNVSHPGETPWIDLSLSWLRRLGVKVEQTGYDHYSVVGRGAPHAFDYQTPGDWSSAAFPLAAALTTGSALSVESLDFDDPQGDKALVPLLRSLGARVEQEGRLLQVDGSSGWAGGEVDMDRFIDALPVMAVAACFAQGETRLWNAGIARRKESDRLKAITQELRKMGAQIQEGADYLVIRPSPLRGAKVLAHDDHRVAMALAVAAMGAQGESEVVGVDCVAKTYPSFCEDFQALGGHIVQESVSGGV